MGDPAGIGPEIIAKAVDSGELVPLCRPVAFGDAAVMRKVIDEIGLSVSVHAIASPSEAAPEKGRLDVLDLGMVDLAYHQWGRPDISSGRAVVAYVKKAAEAALAGEADARAGGSRSIGSRGSRSYSRPVSPSTQPAPSMAPQPAPQPMTPPPFQQPQPAGGGFLRSMAGFMDNVETMQRIWESFRPELTLRARATLETETKLRPGPSTA